MAVDHQTTLKPPSQTPLVTTSQYRARRRTFFLLRRRRNKQLPTVRLGGKKQPPRGVFILSILKELRLRWLKLKYKNMLRKLRRYYMNLINDIVEAGAAVESLQHPMFMEYSNLFGVPVMGVSS